MVKARTGTRAPARDGALAGGGRAPAPGGEEAAGAVRPGDARRGRWRVVATDKVEYVAAGRRQVAFLAQLGLDGMLLRSATGLDPGARVELRLHLDRAREPLAVRGVVTKVAVTGAQIAFEAAGDFPPELVRHVETVVLPALEKAAGGPRPSAQKLLELAALYADLGRDAAARETSLAALALHRADRTVYERAVELMLGRVRASEDPALLAELEGIVVAGLSLGASALLKAAREELRALAARAAQREADARRREDEERRQREEEQRRAEQEQRNREFAAEVDRAIAQRRSDLEQELAARERSREAELEELRRQHAADAAQLSELEDLRRRDAVQLAELEGLRRREADRATQLAELEDLRGRHRSGTAELAEARAQLASIAREEAEMAAARDRALIELRASADAVQRQLALRDARLAELEDAVREQAPELGELQAVLAERATQLAALAEERAELAARSQALEARAAEAEAARGALEREREEAAARLQALEARAAQAEAARGALERQLEGEREALVVTQQKLMESQQACVAGERGAERLQAEVAALRAEIDGLHGRIEELAREATDAAAARLHEWSGLDTLESLSGGERPPSIFDLPGEPGVSWPDARDPERRP